MSHLWFKRPLKALAIAALGVASIATVGVPSTAAAEPSTCPDVQLIFARGTQEISPLGFAGWPVSEKLTDLLPGTSVSTYAVQYAASWNQHSSGAGATDLTRKVTQVAAQCAETTFVLGGYSQGATVVTIAVGLDTPSGTPGEALPPALAERISAIVVFGNPLGRDGRDIESDSPLYGPKTKSFCTAGDPVCTTGWSFPAHLSYLFNGDLDRAAAFAASRVAAELT